MRGHSSWICTKASYHRTYTTQHTCCNDSNGLETACLRLLQKSPDDRFASANHLLQYISLSTRIIRNRRLFGRAQEMHQLQENVATLARGQGGIVLLEGRHGMGRTRLLQGAQKLLKDFSIPL